MQLRTYIVNHDQDKLEILLRHLGNLPPTQTLFGVAPLALPNMLFEVDAIAITDKAA